MSLLHRIEHNEITELKIDAMSREAFEGKKKDDVFLEVMGKNHSITSVRFEGDFLACLRGDVRSNVVIGIGKLPAIRSIYLGDSLLLAPDLTEMLVNAKNLRVLHLRDVCLQGAPDFVEALATVLKHHATLKDFELINSMASNQSVDLERLREAAAVNRSSCSSGGMNKAVTANTATAKSA